MLLGREKNAKSGSSTVLGQSKLLSAGNKYSFSKCKLGLKGNVLEPMAIYCQNCAFQKGICAGCGMKTVDITMHRQRNV